MFDTAQSKIVSDAIATITSVDPRLGNALSFLNEFPGIIHTVMLNRREACEPENGDDYKINSHIYLSPDYSPMSLIMASCMMLKQSILLMEKARSVDLDDQIIAVESALEIISDEFKIKLDDSLYHSH